jgi:hypothetical protein
MLFRRGVNANQVQMWMGHHSPAFTLAVYVELLPSDLPDGDVLEGDNSGTASLSETGRNGIDIVPSTSPENVRRLELALDDLNAPLL